MPTLIDSLVVAFGLDPRGFQQGAKTVQDTDRKTRDQLDKSQKETETRARKVAGAYKAIGSEIRNLSLIALGATGIADLVKTITQGDAATGRLAKNLGMATEKLSAWEGAIRRVGGSPADADSALQGITSAFQNYQLTGNSGHDADFKGLGVSLNDLGDPEKALLRIAQASEHMSKPEFAARAGRIGISPDMINLLEKGRNGVQRLLDEQRSLGVVTEQDAVAAIKMQDAWGKLSTKLIGDVRPAVTGLLNDILSLTTAVEDFSSKGGLDKWAQDFDKAHPFFGAIDEVAKELGDKWRRLWSGQAGKPPTPGHPAIVYQDAHGNVIARPTTGLPDASLGTPRTQGRAVALQGNNPGGINNGAWASRQPGYMGANGRYAQFRTMDDGIHAQEALLRSYVARGYDTPWKIAQRWAPRGDGNDPSAYARNIAQRLGIGVNDQIGKGSIEKFANAQAMQENRQFGRAVRTAAIRPGGASGGSTTDVHVGQIVINAPHADPHAVAAEVPKALKRRTQISQANSGLSG